MVRARLALSVLGLSAFTAGCARHASGVGVATLTYTEPGESTRSFEVPVRVESSCFDSCDYTLERTDGLAGTCPAFEGRANVETGTLPITPTVFTCSPHEALHADGAQFVEGEVTWVPGTPDDADRTFRLVYDLTDAQGPTAEPGSLVIQLPAVTPH